MDIVTVSNDLIECQTMAIKAIVEPIVHSRFVRRRFICVRTHKKRRYLSVK